MNEDRVSFLKELSTELDPAKLKRKFLRLLLSLQNVERGSIWVKVEEGYKCIDAEGEQSGGILDMVLSADKPSIAGWVIENGKMTVAKAGADERHRHEIEDTLEVKSNLILCYPLLLRDGTVYGAVEVIDTSAKGDMINLAPEYLALLQDLVDICSNTLGNSLVYSQQVSENKRLQSTLEAYAAGDVLIGSSPLFTKVREEAVSYARTDYPVIIYGESGTGKELLAREIYKRSARHGKPFLVQNCSTIPAALLESELFGYVKGAFTGAVKDKPGLFQAANGGALFLDEIGEMELAFQAKLLRVLQNYEVKPLGGTRVGKVNVRIIAATNRDLEKMVAEGTFREDLFYRLNVLTLRVPPLRKRREDIPSLVHYFFQREANAVGAEPKTLTDEAMQRAMAYDWPGNVRELESCVKECIALVPGKEIGPKHLPEKLTRAAPPSAPQTPGKEDAEDAALSFEGMSWQEVEHTYAMFLMERFKWNISRAARQAGLNRSTFDTRLKKLGIRKKDHVG